ncbi:hypothetical protein HHI36_018742 [Cryptolaemus montrouzieri]|uniref:Calcineurin-like phosphoesterase domain-containing protein n=1 Tax=Cryptolaemus montrouzieri TaxID=559131 RepID=A0ABD2P208_9CUCU
MRMIYFRSINRRKRHIYICIIFTLVIFFVIYTELISYIINTNYWIHLQCLDQTQCLKILLVADPQITGHEQIGSLSSLAQYDSDSFLKRTYLHAVNFVKPDITIFLGDLMDEGSTATNEEYNEYLTRFFDIFPKSGNTKQIWLPGDNDIGGEGFDRVTPLKMQRYQEAFDQADVLNFSRVTFVKVNNMIHYMPKIKEKRDFYNTSQIYFVISHMPLMFMPSIFSEKVFSKIQPQVIFAAHQHKAMIISTDGLLRQDRQIIPQTPLDNKVHNLILGYRDMYEILVPTCSYRMGTKHIGYGYALLENGELQYTVLWSPSRFHLLWNYILILLIMIIFVSIVVIKTFL